MVGPFSFGASALPQQQQQPTDPNQMMMQMFQQMMQQQQPQQQQQGPDLGALLAQLRNDPQGDQNKAYMPGVQNQANPFDNGFFKTGDQRQQITQDRGLGGLVGGVGIPSRTDAATNPYAFGPIGQMQEPMVPFAPGFDPQMLQQMSPFQGMIDPMQPDATKFSDQNFFQVQPGVSSLPPGAVAGDGKTNYKRKAGAKASGSPLSGFSFGSK
jgi:hypothetical protein